MAEETRLKSLNNLLNSLGFQEHLYEDFVESTLDLLRQISASIPNQDDDAALLAAFNDPEISNGIITHFRVSRHLGSWTCVLSRLFQPLSVLTRLSIDHALAHHKRFHENERRCLSTLFTRRFDRTVLCHSNRAIPSRNRTSRHERLDRRLDQTRRLRSRHRLPRPKCRPRGQHDSLRITISGRLAPFPRRSYHATTLSTVRNLSPTW